MAKISELPATTEVSGVLPVVQEGATKKLDLADVIADLRPKTLKVQMSSYTWLDGGPPSPALTNGKLAFADVDGDLTSAWSNTDPEKIVVPAGYTRCRIIVGVYGIVNGPVTLAILPTQARGEDLIYNFVPTGLLFKSDLNDPWGEAGTPYAINTPLFEVQAGDILTLDITQIVQTEDWPPTCVAVIISGYVYFEFHR